MHTHNLFWLQTYFCAMSEQLICVDIKALVIRGIFASNFLFQNIRSVPRLTKWHRLNYSLLSLIENVSIAAARVYNR